MLRLSLLGALAALLAATTARPQTGAVWPGFVDGQTSGSIARGAFSGQFVAPQPEQGGFHPVRPLTHRQGRRIAADTVTNQLVATTTTAKPKSKLVTLRPIGNNIQEILFNNNYRETPGEAEPEINNIDDYSQLDGLHPSEVWLLDDDLLVLKGGELASGFIDTTPIDNYEAPYREPKFPPPGFNPDGILPPGMFDTSFAGGQGQRQQEAFIPEFGYDPYGAGRVGRTGQTAPEPRRVLPPAGFQFPSAAPAPAVGDVPRHTHQQTTYVKGRSFPNRQPSAGFIHNIDGLPKSFSTSNSYPAAAAALSGRQQRLALPQARGPAAQPHGAFSAPATTVYDSNGNYMTYTNHDGGFSYSYKTDGKTR